MPLLRDTWVRLVLAFCIALAVPGAACAAAPVGWTTVDVLNQRLSMAMPPGGAALAESEGQPEGRPLRPGEQRIRQHFGIKVGAIPVDVAVSELLAQSDESIEQLAKSYAPTWSQRRRAAPGIIASAVRRDDGLGVVILTPPPPGPGFPGNLVRAAILHRPDRSLMRIDFTVRDAASRASPEVASMADAMIASVALGPRPLNAGKGVVLGDGVLTIDLLPGYTTIEAPGMAARIFNIVPVGPPHADRPTLYFFFREQPQRCLAKNPGGTLKLFGREGEWNAWKDEYNRHNRSTCLFATGSEGDTTPVMVGIDGADARTEQDMLTMLGTARSTLLSR